MKSFLLYILCLISAFANSQPVFRNDTIKINEVLITGKKNNAALAGFKKISADSATLNFYSLGTVAEVMSENAALFIKSYGMGGVATPSFRGTGAVNTQVMWNGIEIDHPMLGQSDFSLLPAGMIDELHIYFGGASMELNSGAAGGIILLETRPVWRKEDRFTLNSGVGSFENYSGLVSGKSGSDNFQSVTKAFFQSAENNFRYLNTVSSSEPFTETRKNNQVRQTGFLQELYYRKSDKVLSARIWYQNADRNLPASLLTQQTAKQSDESIRTLINYDFNKGISSYSVSGAWLMNKMNYSNQLASIDSRNISDEYIIKADFSRNLWDNSRLEIVLNEKYNIVRSNNYEKNAVRNSANLSASLSTLTNGRLNGTFVIRQILHEKEMLLPDFSSGVQIRLLDLKEYFLKANVSRNSRIPTMNDLYWAVGGNKDLKNEYAWIYELNYQMNDRVFSLIDLNYDISVFRNSMKDMIQWHPGEFSYWIADNIQKVNSTGLETSLSLKYKFKRFTSIVNAAYSYTRASDENNEGSHKQLIYTPENQANASLRIKFGEVYSTWKTNMTGKRYTTADNTKYLPAYLLNNIAAGIRHEAEWGMLDISFDIDNLFDINYETIAYYPLPGRTFMIKLLVQIIK